MSNKLQLQTNNGRFSAELMNMINGLVEQERSNGDYVWKKLTTDGGELVDYVVNNDPSAYPDRGYVGQYWYELHKSEGQYVWKKYERGNVLPNGYTQLEYIESTGTQYINTGFAPNGNTRIIFECQLTDNGGYMLFGERGKSEASQADALFLQLSASSGITDYFGTRTNLTGSYSGRLSIDFNKNELTINGVTTKLTASSASSNHNLYLFAENIGSSLAQSMSYLKLYSCQIYNNGVLARDFIPCTNPNGVTGLYDTVTNVFYTDAAGGTLEAGGVYYEFADYVVSDDPTAYPNGGEQDEYWYELYDGVEGIDCGFITNPSQTTSIVVEHSLGVVPRHSILVALKTATTSKTVVATDLFSAYFSGFHNSDYAVANEKTITFNSRNASYPFDAMEFLWIAVA